jgi:TadE-like protein
VRGDLSSRITICHPELWFVIPNYDLSSRAKRGICNLLKINRTARQLAGTNGAEIAEVAMVLPLVFMLLLGIVWFGRAFNIYSTIQQAAQQGAIAAARATCATCVGGNAAPSATAVDGVVVGVLNASNLDTGQIQQWEANNTTPPGVQPCPAPAAAPSCNLTGNNIWVCSSVLLNSATQPAQCGSLVSFRYPFHLNLPFSSLNQVTLSAQAQSRMEN